ncbi:uncharacterized protein LOC120284066 [Dioscorea cayenensis subsp. rotundata]|uniref:Uncharacterized protein LOC120284066 n=1 Tax=Dioscorea cayennensis subsp. rotundata TaxID=55577 RepID=A0AB40D3E9_DIOCR|nr:uncharacterized protein LOC120284066 [Dioscorea cayenensis subsp. rotundata]
MVMYKHGVVLNESGEASKVAKLGSPLAFHQMISFLLQCSVLRSSTNWYQSLMATNGVTATAGSPVTLSQPSISVFTGPEYGRWSLRMKTIFISLELWDLVENGVTESKDEAVERENKKRDARALSIIQQAVDDPNLDRISEAKSAHDAWETLRKQCQGTSKVMAVRIQVLRQDIKILQMRDDEGVQEYVSRVITITNQIKGLGHKLKEPEVVSKVLRSLALKFGWVAVAIEESKEISKLSLDDHYGTLQAHEVRVNRCVMKTGEKVLVARDESSSTGQLKPSGSTVSSGEGRSRGRSHLRGRERNNRG